MGVDRRTRSTQLLYWRMGELRRADDWDSLPLVAPEDLEVGPIDRYDRMLGIKLAHPNKAKIREVRIAISVSLRERRQLDQMIAAVKRDHYKPFLKEPQDDRHALQVKCRLGQDSLAGQQRLGHALCDLHCPVVVAVVSIRECDQKAGIGDALQERENPLRFERSRGPRIVPARCRNDWAERSALARSSCSRMIRPRGIPDFLDTSSNQAASSFVRRIVTV